MTLDSIADEVLRVCSANIGAICSDQSAAGLRPRHFQLIANRAGRRFLDFAMSSHGGAAAICRIAIDRVVRSLAVERAAVPLQMSNEIAALNQTATSTVKVSQIAPVGAILAALSR